MVYKKYKLLESKIRVLLSKVFNKKKEIAELNKQKDLISKLQLLNSKKKSDLKKY